MLLIGGGPYPRTSECADNGLEHVYDISDYLKYVCLFLHCIN
jgi:hypothetical protein